MQQETALWTIQQPENQRFLLQENSSSKLVKSSSSTAPSLELEILKLFPNLLHDKQWQGPFYFNSFSNG